ncbi:transglycosylase SLT domain-containing protein [Vulgatibacter incomptus]|uniref:Soluble lytic murein transglycosylase n=1 Tax=Vulgatibacter incomptus TaxID=1391653 RepID=A0A0K1P8T7_9BACT|nr:transglycosylase SLT domain-containing protein [Vulgatibacter incomptus]AKU89935.1 Soluble lytic murein transglycosylase precursor [Vulgatibacter incomptus]
MKVRSRWPLRVVGVLVFGLLASAPLRLSPSQREEQPRFALDPEVEGIARYLEWRAPASLAPSLRRQVANALVEESRQTGLDPLLILAVIAVESDFVPDAVSAAQAKGLLQIRDVAAREIVKHEELPEKSALEPEEVVQLRLGIRYLALMTRRFSSLDRALAAWNAGPVAVARELASSGTVPDRWLSFARKVARERRHLRTHFGQDAATKLAVAPGSPVAPE